MNRRKRPFWLLLLSLLSLGGLIYLIFLYPPSYQLHLPLEALAKWGITNYKLPIIIPFFCFFFLFFFFLLAYFLRNTRRAMLTGLLIIIYLIFRMFHLNNLYFLLLLLALFISLELFFKKHI
jgi:hypothetical protein